MENEIIKEIKPYLNLLCESTNIEEEETLNFSRATFHSKKHILTFIKIIKNENIFFSINEKISDSRFKEIFNGSFEAKFLQDYFLDFSSNYLDLKLLIHQPKY